MLKILLTNIINPASSTETKMPSLGVAYLVSYVRKYYNKPVEFKIASRDVKKEVDEFKPDIIGISSVSQNYDLAKDIAAYCKEKGIFTIIGGIHISMLPITLDKNMDLGILHEGEQTFLEIVKEYEENKGRINFEKIKGIVYWKEGKPAFTGSRELIQNLDLIPFPARDLLDINKRNIYLFSSRGCPYRCIFCASSRYWNKVRFHSAEYVVEEIKTLVKEYGVKDLAFLDDLFIADKGRIRRIIELIEKNQLDVTFNIQGRANLIDEEMLTLLKRMKVKTIGIGLESGNNRVLQYLKGKNISIEDNERAVKLIKKFGIDVTATFVMGAPTETKEEISDTMRFIKKNIDDFYIFLLTPFPGTPIWDYAVSKGLVSNDVDWSKLDVKDYHNFHDKIILSETLNADELQKMHRQFQRLRMMLRLKVFMREGLEKPGRILPFLYWKAKRWFLLRIEAIKSAR